MHVVVAFAPGHHIKVMGPREQHFEATTNWASADLGIPFNLFFSSFLKTRCGLEG